MNVKLRSGVLAVFFVTAIACYGSAEDPSNGNDILGDIKSQMVSAVEMNNQLAVENKELKAQLVGLQLEIERYEQDIEALDPEYTRIREQSPPPEAASAGWNSSQGDALIREAQGIYLSGQFMKLNDAQRLRELKLYDLQYEKQEKQLDLKSLEFLNQKYKDQQTPELKTIETEIQADEEKIKEISLWIAQEEKAALSYPQRIELLKMENKALKEKIKQLKQLLSK